MNRRGFLGSLLGVMPLASAPLALTAARTEQPYTRSVVFCPKCGLMMFATTRYAERPAPDCAYTWSCAPCRVSWRVPAMPLAAEPIAYDSGERPGDKNGANSAAAKSYALMR
jgi:hypothetical protein